MRRVVSLYLPTWATDRLRKSAQSGVPWDRPLVTAVQDAVEAELGRRPEASTTGGTSDARFIRALCPVLELGLVGQTMHQFDERVPVDEIVALTGAYRRIIESVLGPATKGSAATPASASG